MSDAALAFEEALRQVLAEASPLPVESVPFHEAAGRVLAEPLRAERDDPPATKSAMDGFALKAAHTVAATPGRPLRFQFSEVIAAGRLACRPLPEPSAAAAAQGLPAARIMTGALLPVGADAVVKQEHTESDGSGRFLIRRPLAPGENAIPAGARMARGEPLLEAGEPLGPQALGILAAARCERVRTHRRPVVALLALGDELADIGDPLGPGQTPVTNLHVLTALVSRYGGVPRSLGVAPDDPELIRTRLETCLAGSRADDGTPPCDLVLTLGGSHRGDFDYVHTVLERLGASLRFDRIRMTPGSSTVFALHGSTLCFGLPGTPSASWAAFEVLVRPALWRLAGRTQLELPRLKARLTDPLPHEHGQTAFVACRVRWAGGEPEATPILGRHPHEPPAAGRADGLIRCPEGQRLPAVGEWVGVDWLAD